MLKKENKKQILSSEEIRERFLKFFERRGHAIIPSASLVPENDPSVLFNTAGMQPLVPYLLGEEHPKGKRLVNVQKCVRTNDIEEVGDKTHFTFFEMLGNWSLGDYFKKEAIEWSYEFLTNSEEGLGLDPERLYVTVFLGNNDAPKDLEALEVWKKLLGEERIYFTEKDNWWEAGDNGPCGPDSEMFYDRTKRGLGIMSEEEFFTADERQDIVEIWNDVFMEYKKENGKVIEKLPKQNVDTGAGLERVTAILQNVDSPYETDLFLDILDFLEKQTEKKYEENLKDFRIIADHIRAAVFLIGDGVIPDNKDQGYILRRLIRRALVKMNNIGFVSEDVAKLARIIIKKYEKVHTNLTENKKKIETELQTEINKFSKTLEKGLKEFEKIVNPEIKNNHIQKLEFGMCVNGNCALNEISGEDAFRLFTTYGFPLELIQEEAIKRNMIVDAVNFKKLLVEHQKKSQTATVGKFKGGLGGDSEKTKSLHTATHLMLAGLRKFLGDHVIQKGANITEERIRFDFTNNEKVSREILDQVEDFVNQIISEKVEVQIKKMSKKDAEQDKNITGSFWEKYPDEVTIYQIGNYSQELCGGPHVKNTEKLSEFGNFKITKEKSSSAGVRRIKAILEKQYE